MKSCKLVVVAVVGLLVTSCAGIDYAMKNYKGVAVQNWTSPTNKHSYRIFDKPEENRLMITLGLGDAAAQGFGQGLTLGAADTRTPEIVYQDAAIEWLASKGRTCTATQTFLVIEPQYEIRYLCSTPAPTASL